MIQNIVFKHNRPQHVEHVFKTVVKWQKKKGPLTAGLNIIMNELILTHQKSDFKGPVYRIPPAITTAVMDGARVEFRRRFQAVTRWTLHPLARLQARRQCLVVSGALKTGGLLIKSQAQPSLYFFLTEMRGILSAKLRALGFLGDETRVLRQIIKRFLPLEGWGSTIIALLYDLLLALKSEAQQLKALPPPPPPTTPHLRRIPSTSANAPA